MKREINRYRQCPAFEPLIISSAGRKKSRTTRSSVLIEKLWEKNIRGRIGSEGGMMTTKGALRALDKQEFFRHQCASPVHRDTTQFRGWLIQAYQAELGTLRRVARWERLRLVQEERGGYRSVKVDGP